MASLQTQEFIDITDYYAFRGKLAKLFVLFTLIHPTNKIKFGFCSPYVYVCMYMHLCIRACVLIVIITLDVYITKKVYFRNIISGTDLCVVYYLITCVHTWTRTRTLSLSLSLPPYLSLSPSYLSLSLSYIHTSIHPPPHTLTHVPASKRLFFYMRIVYLWMLIAILFLMN